MADVGMRQTVDPGLRAAADTVPRNSADPVARSASGAIPRQMPALPVTEWLSPQPPATRFTLQGDASVCARMSGAWGAELSDVPCRAGSRGGRAALWLGPEEFLLLSFAAADADPAALATTLGAQLRDLPHALVDVSHRQVAVEVHGPHAASILNGGCPLDLDPSQFPVGMCTRTVFAKADIVLWRTAEDAFHVEIWRSFADYVTALLCEIARDYYP
jgi:sarcosine oxidase subunit gamma